MKRLARLALPFVMGMAIISVVSVALAATKKPAGQETFMEKCSMCHGMNGKGYAAIKTPNFTDPKWQAAHSDKVLMEAIENGVSGTAMPSFKGKLDHAQMTAVLKYIRSLGSKKSE